MILFLAGFIAGAVVFGVAATVVTACAFMSIVTTDVEEWQ